jgi:hypothetical protein
LFAHGAGLTAGRAFLGFAAGVHLIAAFFAGKYCHGLPPAKAVFRFWFFVFGYERRRPAHKRALLRQTPTGRQDWRKKAVIDTDFPLTLPLSLKDLSLPISFSAWWHSLSRLCETPR